MRDRHSQILERLLERGTCSATLITTVLPSRATNTKYLPRLAGYFLREEIYYRQDGRTQFGCIGPSRNRDAPRAALARVAIPAVEQ